jgi:hypothetical protein
MGNENVYKTKDFYLGATLLAYGIPLQKLECITPGVYYFVFRTSEQGAAKIINAYWDGTLKLPVRNFVEAVNELKTRLHLEK